MDSHRSDRQQRIQSIVRDCLQKWATGQSFEEIEIVDAHLDLAPELGLELRKLRLVGQAAVAAEAPAQPVTGAHLGFKQGSGLRVRCPHCRNALEVLEDDSVEMHCDSCGGEFSIAGDEHSAPLDTGAKLGHFQLQDLLGTGSFGSVWRAHDQELDREVAIKVPRRSQLDPTQAAQFLREARIAAQLDHPHIVSVHEIGREQDTVYIVSDLVDGVPLSTWSKHRTCTVKETVQLCETLARALQHAHDKGVVHRDLKPANVMIDSDDQPRIMDFGLAKRDVGEITMTADGQVLGTPAYMSPEQAMGDSHRVDGRSDIYSLGVMLFELLTGELPFRGSVRMLIQQVIHDDPPSPRRLVANLHRDLETICLKCLAKDRSARYASARQVADELQRFSLGKPIIARPVSRIDRAWRWGKRNPMAAAVIGCITFLAIAGPAYAWHEREQRTAIESLYTEKLNLIAELVGGKKTLDQERTRAEESFVPAYDNQLRPNKNAFLADVAARKYANTVKTSPKGLIAAGNFYAAAHRTDEAIAAWEQAIQLLEEDAPTREHQLAIADCLTRLGELYLTKSPESAVELAARAASILQALNREAPDLTSQALLIQARGTLGMAYAQTNRRRDGLKLLAKSAAENEKFSAALPENVSDSYETSHWLFTKVPPLLP